MMLPLHKTTAIIYGCGDIDNNLLSKIDTKHRLIICVNRASHKHKIDNPDITLWIDAGIWNDIKPVKNLCVHDKSVDGPQGAIALPMRCGLLSKYINPNWLYHLANTAAVATIWAVSVGCEMVAMLGCECEDDGRDKGQLRAMEKARDRVLRAYSGARIITTPTDWNAWRYEATGLKRLYNDEAACKLREFYY